LLCEEWKVKVIVHVDKCIGAGNCVGVAPDVFAQGDHDGLVILLVDKPSTAGQRDAVRAAAHACPSLAIEIQED
jgi:ferredoxin